MTRVLVSLLAIAGACNPVPTSSPQPAFAWQRSTPSTDEFRTQMLGVAGDDVVVAVGGGGRGVGAAVWHASTIDSWQRVPTEDVQGAADALMTGVAQWRDGFVAVGYDTSGQGLDAAVWTSVDGLQWQRVAPPPDFGGPANQSMGAVAFGDGRLVAVGRADGIVAVELAIWVSEDGISWRRLANEFVPHGRDLSAVAYDGADFVAVGEARLPGGSAVVLTSPDGLRWTRASETEELSGGLMEAVLPWQSTYVSVGCVGTEPGAGTMAASWQLFGSEWRRTLVPAGGDSHASCLNAVAAYRDGLLAVGTTDGGAASWLSEDGSTWTRFPMAATEFAEATLDAMVTAQGHAIVVGSVSEPSSPVDAHAVVWTMSEQQ